ncbi:hypothetical protein BDR26DRAFT_905030 [Obelidium mucronatum]|nr:hypothetical protein BDR26DRAFT_905030 [Obelidium mucronatum]
MHEANIFAKQYTCCRLLSAHQMRTESHQFLTEPNSLFRIDKPWGMINPHTSVALTVKFSPTEPINYHRRVYCLVENQDAIFIDFIGTCYNEKRRPATFHPKMLDSYRKRVKNGLWSFGPEHLEEMLKNGTIQCKDGVLSFVHPEKYQLSTPPLDYPYNNGLVASEYFYDNVAPDHAVTLMDTYIDFGSCSKYRVIDAQIIRIANNTKGKMSCVWHLPGESAGDEPIFSVSPSIADIPSKSSMEFRVHFRPKTDNSFYGQQLECFVYFKSMRNFRLVNEDTFTPPWCLTPTVAGNTFPPGEDTFIPKIEFGTSRLDFPACYVDKSVYQTVRITNAGDTPVKYAFVDTQFQFNAMNNSNGGNNNGNAQDLLAQGIGGGTPLALQGGVPFSVKPRIGMLHKNESRLVVFRFSPSEQKTYEQAMKCFFNSSVTNTYLTTIRELRYNSSPNAEKNWALKLPCYYSLAPEERNALRREEQKNNSDSRRNLARKLVSSLSRKLWTLRQFLSTQSLKRISLYSTLQIAIFSMIWKFINFNWWIHMKRANVTKDGPNKTTALVEVLVPNSVRESELEIMEVSDIFPARSNHVLKFRACVREQTDHQYRIYYKMKTQSKLTQPHSELMSSTNSESQKDQRFHLCDMRALGVYPIVQVTDVRSEGLGKGLLWKFFSLRQFNQMLEAVETGPSNFTAIQELEEEFDFPTEGVTGGEYKEPPSLDFNFGAAPVGTKPVVVHMSLMNPGVVPVEWVFFFPNDLEVEIENWADPGDYTEEQLHTNLILDNNLFSISPKTGILNPGESAHITMSYIHKFPGLHKLPVIFKLKNGSTRSGKEIILYFVGNCIPLEQKCLFFPSTRHSFEPVSIGCPSPPIQRYRLANYGLVHLSYTIDLTPLKKFKTREKDFDIFKCNKVSGSIPPGGVEYIKWIFRPLEVKEYSVDIPITTDDGQTTIITFVGQGLEEPLHHMNLNPKFDDAIPKVQILPMSNQIGVLSKEHINLGDIPIGAQFREILVVRNISKTEELSFNWVFPCASWGTNPCVKVAPSSGTLSPGDSRVCKLVFTPSSEICVCNLDIECQILNETEKDIRIAQREGRLVLDSRINTAHSKQLLGSAGKTKHSLRGSKYNLLPDINGSKDSNSVPDLTEVDVPAVSNKPLETGLIFYVHHIPAEPQPYPLFVTIHANIHPVDEFRSLFGHQDQFFRVASVNYEKVADNHLDTEVQNLIVPENAQPLPYFAQITMNRRNGIIPAAFINTGNENSRKEENSLLSTAILSSPPVPKPPRIDSRKYII